MTDDAKCYRYGHPVIKELKGWFFIGGLLFCDACEKNARKEMKTLRPNFRRGSAR